MKKQITLFAILACLISHAKQILAIGAIAAPVIAEAQYIQDYRPPIKGVFYPGNWTGNDLYSVMDSASKFTIFTKFYLPGATTATSTATSALYIDPITKEVVQANLPSSSGTVSLTAGAGIILTGSANNYTISAYAPLTFTASRSVNTTYTVSAKESMVWYSITCTVTNPLLAGSSTANAFLEYSTNGGSTWIPCTQQAASSSVGLTVSVQLTSGQTGVLIGSIPGGASVRIRTTTTGSASVGNAVGQERY